MSAPADGLAGIGRTAPDRRGRTLVDKLWEDHEIADLGDETSLLEIDRHVLHEVSSPEAFRTLERQGRAVAMPGRTLATEDHIVSTAPGRGIAPVGLSRDHVEALRRNCAAHGIQLLSVGDARQGIVHIVAAELGFVLPGTTHVCGDSHTATLGALGALAWGVGTSEVAHVLATQTLAQRRPRPLRIRVEGALPAATVAKDLILRLIRENGIAAGVGMAAEYAGSTIRGLSIEARMTICNMSIEFGARFGLIAPDDAVFAYLHGRPLSPAGAAWDAALSGWRALRSDDDAVFAREIDLDVRRLAPQISWGTTPEAVIDIDEPVPVPGPAAPVAERDRFARTIAYMGLEPGRPLEGLPVDVVFIGSCTNARLSDLQQAAALVRGRRVAPGIRALVVPGSGAVKRAAEREGLDRVFVEAGFEWRDPGCSMCLAINEDAVPPGARCVSTSNRNFQGRQGPGSRTHLASPLTAAATALAGRIADPRKSGAA